MTEKLQVVMGRKTPQASTATTGRERQESPVQGIIWSTPGGHCASVWGEGESSHASERDIHSACLPISTVSATLEA